MLPVQLRVDTFFDSNRLEILFPHLLKQFLIFIHQALIEEAG